jgi:hypothetical protein
MLHSHASLQHSLATLQTYGLLIRVAKPSYTTGTLYAMPNFFGGKNLEYIWKLLDIKIEK